MTWVICGLVTLVSQTQVPWHLGIARLVIGFQGEQRKGRVWQTQLVETLSARHEHSVQAMGPIEQDFRPESARLEK